MLMAVGLDLRSAPCSCNPVREHRTGLDDGVGVGYGELSRTPSSRTRATSSHSSLPVCRVPGAAGGRHLALRHQRGPGGDDQRQHIEITRDIAERFNSHYGQTFVLPEAVIPRGCPVMDLQQPTNKMSKSLDSPGTVGLLDEPKQIEKKIGAVTDTDGEVRFDISRPGVSNLLSILGAATDRDPASLADHYQQYGPLKLDTAEALIALLEPIQTRYRELESDPGETARLLKVGADKAREIAAATMTRVRHNIGLLTD